LTNLLPQFRAHWTTHFSRLAGKQMLLAVSGGIDSMVLAHLLKECGIPFGVAHCNFGLRAEASDLDEQLVRDWCAAAGVQFHTTKFETKKRSEEWKKGTQETARILRYEWFATVMSEFGYARVATAHHANDNVETLLINLFRGTGIQGLHGMLPDNGSVIRPLLFATRKEIADYAVTENVAYREDESNASDDYLRNALRHNVVPAVEQLFPNAVVSVNESIGRFAEAELLYNRAIAAEQKQLLEKRGLDYYIPVRKLRHRQPLATICYELLQPFGFVPAQLSDILGLITAGTGRFVASPTHRVIRNRDFLIITALADGGADVLQIDDVASLGTIDTGKFRFTLSAIDRPAEIPQDAERAYIDLNAVTFPLILRRWRIGDYFYPLGMGMKKKKVSRLLIDLKVPLHEKENVWVLESNKRIIWVAGIRLDERFKIKPSTSKVLLVTRTINKDA
jgi:tRNA(Ile)-lysidine synthase